MNNVILIGRLTKDPELRYTEEKQTAVCRFSIAIDKFINNKKSTDFIRITVFGKQAENANLYLSKGREVAIQGRLQSGSYEKDGKTIYTLDVIAERVKFIGGKPNEQDDGTNITAEPSEDFAMIEEDVPF